MANVGLLPERGLHPAVCHFGVHDWKSLRNGDGLNRPRDGSRIAVAHNKTCEPRKSASQRRNVLRLYTLVRAI